MRSTDVVKLSTALLLAVGAASSAQAQIRDLGTLPGGATASANGVSADGSVIAGVGATETFGHGVVWRSGLPIDLGVLPTGRLSIASAVSGDGSVVVGYSGFLLGPGVHAVLWISGGLIDLTPGTADSSYCWGVNGDGSVAVGEAGGQGFRWTPAAGLEPLGLLAGGTYSQAYGVSDDGEAVVGGGTSEPGYRGFVWTRASGMQPLATLPAGAYSWAWAISRDGTVIVGESDSAAGNRAVRWAGGQVQNLGAFAGATSTSARAANRDGSVIVGLTTTTQGSRAFYWTASSGPVDLNDYLPSVGIDLTGWTLTQASAVSADGRLIVGAGDHQTGEGIEQRAWLVDLNAACYADCDHSTTPPVLNVSDFICFQQAFAAGSGYANCDGSTTPPVLNVNDFICFQTRFAAGCP